MGTLKSFRHPLALFLILQVILPLPLLADVVGKFSEIRGEVSLSRAKANITPKAEDAVQTKDVVSTGDKSRTKLLLNDGSLLSVGQNANLEITEFLLDKRSSIISLRAGAMHTKVERLLEPGSKFEVHTPTAVAGVRGTEFLIVVSNNPGTTIYALTQAISVFNPALPTQVITLTAGQFTTVALGALPTIPAAFTPAMIEGIMGQVGAAMPTGASGAGATGATAQSTGATGTGTGTTGAGTGATGAGAGAGAGTAGAAGAGAAGVSAGTAGAAAGTAVAAGVTTGTIAAASVAAAAAAAAVATSGGEGGGGSVPAPSVSTTVSNAISNLNSINPSAASSINLLTQNLAPYDLQNLGQFFQASASTSADIANFKTALSGIDTVAKLNAQISGLAPAAAATVSQAPGDLRGYLLALRSSNPGAYAVLLKTFQDIVTTGNENAISSLHSFVQALDPADPAQVGLLNALTDAMAKSPSEYQLAVVTTMHPGFNVLFTTVHHGNNVFTTTTHFTVKH